MKLVSWKSCLTKSCSSCMTSSTSLSFSGALAGVTGAAGVLAGDLVVPLGYGGSVVCLPLLFGHYIPAQG
jgi:hypothetical protein